MNEAEQSKLLKPKEAVALIFAAHLEVFSAPMHPAEYAIQTLTADRKRGLIQYEPDTKLYDPESVRRLAHDFLAAMLGQYEADDYWDASCSGGDLSEAEGNQIPNGEVRARLDAFAGVSAPSRQEAERRYLNTARYCFGSAALAPLSEATP